MKTEASCKCHVEELEAKQRTREDEKEEVE